MDIPRTLKMFVFVKTGGPKSDFKKKPDATTTESQCAAASG